jgi:N utilization substance protein B
MKSARRRAREFALQGLYAWQLARAPAAEIVAQLQEARGFDKADGALFDALLRGTLAGAEELERLITPVLDRPIAELSPVERAILMLAAHELKDSPEVPRKVVINEAVELAKSFGGTDGHKYVNGVLDKLSKSLRPDGA